MDKRNLSFLSKFGYGLGSIVFAIKDTAFNTFLLFYYTQVLGLSGTLAGSALLIALCIDAITDPIMGSISDTFQSKFGRRHPFMIISAIPLSIVFYALFAPMNGLGQIGLFIWMTTFVIAVRMILTVYWIPYLALGAEMTDDYIERTTIATYRTTFGWFGGVGIAIISYATFFSQTQEFKMGQLNISGYPPFGIFCAVLIVIMAFSCVFLTFKEIPFLPAAPEKKVQFSFARLYNELKMALRNSSFRIIFIASLFSGALMGVTVNLQLHMNTYFWELKSKDMALIASSMLIAAVIAFTLMKWFERFDKKVAYITINILMVLHGYLIILRLFDLLPPNGSSLLFSLIYFQTLYIITLIIMQTVLISSIIADTVDEGELITSVRQEGMYFAFLSFSTKGVTGLGTLFAGIIIDVINLPSKAIPGTVDPEIIWNLGFFVGPVLGVLWMIPFFIILRLRITSERMTEIHIALAARKSGKEH